MDRLLFIGPKFYDYHIMIKEEFERKGYSVDYYDDRPSTSFLTKSLIRINKSLVHHKIKKYFKKILQETSMNKYSIVFVLYGQSFSNKMIRELKEKHPESKFIFYMYDPMSSMIDRVEFAKEFDKVLTFDYNDSKQYGYELLPLFYKNTILPNETIIYDASFIGTMMAGKFMLVDEIIRQLKNHDYNVFDYRFIQSKMVLNYYKIKSKDFKKSKVSDFKFKRLDRETCNKVLMQSNIIIDCPKENQTGLTIRTFEAMFANKKLITTNKTIKNYDFYRPENIYVFEGEIDFSDVFFHSEYVRLNKDIIEKYSISNWADEIIK